MKSSLISRRSLLRCASGASLALPFLASAPFSHVVRAQAAPIKRIVFVYLAQNETEDFMPRGDDSSLSLDGTYLSPLAPYTRKTIVIHNLRGRTGHWEGHSEWLTGFSNPDTYRPLGGPSIDQLMAERLRRTTPLPSLELTVVAKNAAARDQAVLAWTRDRLAVPPIHDPYTAFTRVFGNGADGSDPARTLSTSLLNGLMDDFRALRLRLDDGDRRLLDAHLDLLAENERRLVDGGASSDCNDEKSPPEMTNTPDGSEGDIPRKMDHYVDIITTAIRCDITRVFTPGIGYSHDQIRYPFAGCSENFHLVAHRTAGDAATVRRLHFNVRHWQATQIARICAGLESVPTPSGGTLLDETAVVWLPELGYRPSASGGNTHLRTNTPAVIVGGCGGYFRTGRLFDAGGRDYCDLLLTFVHAMGYEDVTSVGFHSQGALEALRA